MSPELENIIEQYNSLPTEIQQVIFYGNLPEFCEALAFIHELNSEQTVCLENEITLILLGFSARENLERILIAQLEIPEETTYSITETIDAEVLNPLAHKLSHYTTESNQSTSVAGAPPAIPEKSEVIPEMRTMASDMAQERSPDRSTFNAAADFEEPAYVSTQPIIEKKVVDVPSFSSSVYPSPKPDAPTTDSRWN